MLTANTPSRTMQTTGIVLLWLVGYAVVVLLIIIGAFIRTNSITGNQGHGPLQHSVS
jgi:hypothetical protein